MQRSLIDTVPKDHERLEFGSPNNCYVSIFQSGQLESHKYWITIFHDDVSQVSGFCSKPLTSILPFKVKYSNPLLIGHVSGRKMGFFQIAEHEASRIPQLTNCDFAINVDDQFMTLMKTEQKYDVFEKLCSLLFEDWKLSVEKSLFKTDLILRLKTVESGRRITFSPVSLHRPL